MVVIPAHNERDRLPATVVAAAAPIATPVTVMVVLDAAGLWLADHPAPL